MSEAPVRRPPGRPKLMAEAARINVSVDQRMLAAIDRWADRRQISRGALVRGLLELALRQSGDLA